MRDPPPGWHGSMHDGLKHPHTHSTKGTYTKVPLVDVQTFAKLAQNRLNMDNIAVVNKSENKAQEKVPSVRLPFFTHGIFRSKWIGHVNENCDLRAKIGKEEQRGEQSESLG